MSVDRATVRQRAAWLSLVVAVALLGVKLAAYFATSSAAVLSDALESIVNVVTASFLVYSVRLSAKPADADHPYGHGKVEDFAAGVEGALIVIAAVAILAESIPRFLEPRPLAEMGIGASLIGFATVVNFLVGWQLLKLGRRENSRALIADGTHLLTDVVTSVGALLAIVLVRATSQLWIDPLIACALAVHILGSGLALVRSSIGRLMDEADDDLLVDLADAIESGRRAGWVDVHHMRAWRAGNLTHVDLHLTVPRFWKVEDAHREVDALREWVDGQLRGSLSAMVHVDPCRARDCPSCELADCAVRDDSFLGRKKWTRHHLTAGPQGEDDAE